MRDVTNPFAGGRHVVLTKNGMSKRRRYDPNVCGCCNALQFAGRSYCRFMFMRGYGRCASVKQTPTERRRFGRIDKLPIALQRCTMENESLVTASNEEKVRQRIHAFILDKLLAGENPTN